MRHITPIAPLLIVLAGPVCASAPTTLFGIPFDDKPKSTLKDCSALRKPINEICWDGKHDKNKRGEQEGQVRLPTSSSRPPWAEFVSFSIKMNKDLVIGSIKTEISDVQDKLEVVKSISSRFGSPTSAWKASSGQDHSYKWSSKDIEINMLCSGKCWIEFINAELRTERDELRAARDSAQKAKPVSP